MRRTTFSQQLDLLDSQRTAVVTLPSAAVLSLVEQLRQLLIELTDRQSAAHDPDQEGNEHEQDHG
jgi:hypothetical protein